MSRGQLARKLRISPAVLYNLETGRSRLTLGVFVRTLRMTGKNPATAFGGAMLTVRGDDLFGDLFAKPDHKMSQAFTTLMRGRIGISQRELARQLGYSSSAMVHHFEKGIREMSLVDALHMMRIAGDNLRSFVTAVDSSEAAAVLAADLPSGRETAAVDWAQYWKHPWVAGMRQIMRSDFWYALPRYEFGFFSDLLGITSQEERVGLNILGELGIIHWQNAKPFVDPEARIVVPRGIDRSTLDRFKKSWIESSMTRFHADANADDSLMSVDLIPANRDVLTRIRQIIREAQDSVHTIRLRDTDGFISVGWLAAYVPCSSKKRRKTIPLRDQ